MTHKFLDDANICAMIEQVGRKCMAQHAGVVIPPASMSFVQCDRILSRTIVLHISKGHFVSINMELVSENMLGKRLHVIYRERAERVLFVWAEPEVTIQEVAEVLDLASGSVEDLYVSLVTPAAEREPCLAIFLPAQLRASPGAYCERPPDWLPIPPGLK